MISGFCDSDLCDKIVAVLYDRMAEQACMKVYTYVVHVSMYYKYGKLYYKLIGYRIG